MKAYRPYVGLSTASILFTAGYLLLVGAEMEQRGILHLLSDGFALPGLLWLLVGGLLAVKAAGALDGLGYLVKTGVHLLLFHRGDLQSYRSYRQEKAGKKPQSPAPWCLVGAADLALAAIFLCLYGAAI